MNYIDTETLAYPLSERDIRAAFPNTSFPAPFSPPEGYEWVFPSPQPSYDQITQVVREIAPVLTSKGNYEQQWETAPRFSEYTDNEGVLHTVQAQEELAIAEDQANRTQALQTGVIQSTQQRLDDFAATRNYDGILSACTYATSTVPKFQVEGQYCVNARDDTWATLYQLFDDVTKGVKPMPTSFYDVEPLLPPLEWPN